MRGFLASTVVLFAIVPRPAWAQADPEGATADAAKRTAPDLAKLQAQIDAQRRAIEEQRHVLDAQELQLRQLQDSLLEAMRGTGIPGPQYGQFPLSSPASAPGTAPGAAVASLAGTPQSGATPTQPGTQPADGLTSVGEKPAERPRPQEVAVLAAQGSVLTRAGRLTLEPTFQYARDDRNRFVFRGIEVPQSVLVGVFDINESRQDVLTAAATVRYGLTNRIELGVQVPWIYRDDTAVLVPLVQNPPQSGTGTVNTSAHATGLGDIQLLGRYQINNGTGGWPFLTANVQVVVPTGTDPYGVPRDVLGNATKAATGFGFWGVQPSVTVIMPSDPATIFGVLGYTQNFGKDVNTRISDAQIDHVKPGSGPNMTVGVGLALNERASISFAYAHNWLFGTKSRIRPIETQNGIETYGDPLVTSTRDLQIGRFLFGISYRVNQRTTINWSVEMGVTDDATDMLTSLRIPITFFR
ncbi:transporter [Novosphingobium sp. BL-8H]|uniref:transporter n=1 Tax=Novosphingobium sp. BL-8H TaxID=3127640 RepID=UPI003757B07F